MTRSVAESETLLNTIVAHIDANGPLSFADYMQMALYAPVHGYYRSGAIKFGAEGDFVTAPELSPLFGRCVARSVQQVRQQIGGDVLEVGAGSGQLALQVLQALDAEDALPEHYYILELSAELKARQHKLLEAFPQLIERVVWLSAWPEAPFTGVVLANELLDAMPVCQFVMRESLHERYVTHNKGQLCWMEKLASPILVETVSNYQIEFAQGYQSEVNLLLRPWLAALSAVLEKAVVLLFDYGYPREEYYHPQRSMGTLMCHHQHQAHPDPLQRPGEQDITAFVDFTLVAEAATESRLDVLGFTHQAGYLLDCGIASLVEDVQDAATQFALGQQLKQLMLPGQMGEAFKAMALGRAVDMDVLGFQSMNQMRRL